MWSAARWGSITREFLILLTIFVELTFSVKEQHVYHNHFAVHIGDAGGGGDGNHQRLVREVAQAHGFTLLGQVWSQSLSSLFWTFHFSLSKSPSLYETTPWPSRIKIFGE